MSGKHGKGKELMRKSRECCGCVLTEVLFYFRIGNISRIKADRIWQYTRQNS